MKALNVTVACALLLVLPGCGGNIWDWGQETFYQGNKHYNSEHRAAVMDYTRTLRMYDEFTTLGLFDAMWLSDEIRTVYAQLYTKMMGKDEDAEKTFLRRQLKANEHYISFYVLSTSYVFLTAKPTQWAVYLEVDGKKFLPFEIKAVELPIEYVTFFGPRLTRHKHPYEIKFDRKDPNGNDLLSPDKPHTMRMFFSNPKHFASVVWDIEEGGIVHFTKRRHLFDAQPGQEVTPCHIKTKKQTPQEAKAAADRKVEDDQERQSVL